MRGSVYSPPPAYEPAFWSIACADPKYTARIGKTAAAGTNTAWVANLAVYVPFALASYTTIYEWFWVNGTLTTAHNIDFGIYRQDFTKIQSLGSTVGATTASVLLNTSTWTDLVLAPGNYYMAFADDSTRNLSTSADASGLYQAQGCMEQTASSFPLPSPAVPIAYTRAFLPLFGFNMRTVAL